MTDYSSYALALILKARGTARSVGLTVTHQCYSGQTLQILMCGPNILLKQGPIKTSFEELLSHAETTTFLSRNETLEIMLHFDLGKIDQQIAGER